jgi:hypothetical protein
MDVIWVVAPCSQVKVYASEVLAAFVVRDETSVNFYQTTRRNNPDDSQLHVRCREILKFYTS